MSPISLRPRGAPIDRVGVNVENSSDIVDMSVTDRPWGLEEDDGLHGYHTPPQKQPRHHVSDGHGNTVQQPRSNFCQFSVLDFQPGAPPPSSIDRQSVGDYHPNLHDCGVGDCPFTEISPEARSQALQAGMPVEGNLSPDDHPKVDHRAFPHPVRVKVPLEHLGQDSSMVQGLLHLSGEVQHRYYHEVHGNPMFTVDFGGTIGIRELRVCDTLVDNSADHESMGHTVRALDFAEMVSSPVATQSPDNAEQHPVTDSDPSDVEWEGAFEDFASDTSSGMSEPHSPGSVSEDPLLDLGVYNSSEDTTGWPFERMWADDQWMETNCTFLGDWGTFRGPTPSPIGPRGALPAQPVDYFMKYWPPDVLQRIILETNRYFSHTLFPT